MFRRTFSSWMPAIVAVVLLPGADAAGAGISAEPDPPPTTVIENVFLPEDANIGDCVSALPRPECGSEARGGWRQALILAALVGGLGVIGWRIVVGVRGKRTEPTAEKKPERTP